MESEQMSLLSSGKPKKINQRTACSDPSFRFFSRSFLKNTIRRIPIVIRRVPLEISVLFSFTIVCFAA